MGITPSRPACRGTYDDCTAQHANGASKVGGGASRKCQDDPSPMDDSGLRARTTGVFVHAFPGINTWPSQTREPMELRRGRRFLFLSLVAAASFGCETGVV